MGCVNVSFFFFFSFSCMGTKRILKKNKKNIMGEIVTVATICFVITLLGLGLGFIFLQVQANT
jgi:TM2 domain-containing membrane protein YozV